MTEPGQTEIKRLRLQDVWHPHVGGRRGNRHAAKTGIPWKALARRLRGLKARLRALQEKEEAR